MQCFFFFNDTATTEIYTLSLHDALPISLRRQGRPLRHRPSALWRSRPRPSAPPAAWQPVPLRGFSRSEEHTSELQSRQYLVCRLLLEKKKPNIQNTMLITHHHPHTDPIT